MYAIIKVDITKRSGVAKHHGITMCWTTAIKVTALPKKNPHSEIKDMPEK